MKDQIDHRHAISLCNTLTMTSLLIGNQRTEAERENEKKNKKTHTFAVFSFLIYNALFKKNNSEEKK